jgi:dihydroorotase
VDEGAGGWELVAELVVANGDVLIGQELVRCDVIIDGGKITGLSQNEGLPDARKTIDAAGLVVIPGLIDTHVHAREPGYTYKEDFETASKAAAAGGITMFMDMPNTDPVPNTLERFLEHRELADKKAVIDFNHWAMPTVLAEIPKIVEAGAIGFKFFMKSAHYPYGDEVSIVDHAQILETMRAIAEVGSRCLVHPHNQMIWEYQTRKWTEEGRTERMAWNSVTYGDHDVIETTPIAILPILAEAVGCRLRILHIQGRYQLRVVRMLKEAGFDFIAETNPWSIARIDPIGIHTPEDVEANLEALRDGTVDIIASDHAPHTREEHAQADASSFQSVIAAYPLCEHYLAIYLTEVNEGRLSLYEFVRAASENVARHLGLYPRKGTIRVGSDADLAIVDLNREAVLGESLPVRSKMGFTPLHGQKVKGVPVYTIARGHVVMAQGEIKVEPGFGKFVPAEG